MNRDRAALAQVLAMALDLAKVASALLAAQPDATAAAWIPIAQTGLPRRTAMMLVKTGRIAGKRVGRGYLVDPASVAAYLATPDAAPGTDPLAAELGIVVRG